MGEPLLLPSANVAAADWIKPRLAAFGSAVAAVVPEGFPAYVRTLHPVHGPNCWQGWADLAARSGRIMHRLAQFHAIARPAGAPPNQAEPWRPQEGSLAIEEFRALCSILREHTGTADLCWFCLWEGWGQLHESSMAVMAFSSEGRLPPRPQPAPSVLAAEVLNGPRVRLPHRNYILFEGSLAAAADLPEPFSSQSPNLFWPQDHAWCVASEIDLSCTLVAGTEALADALLSDPRLETWRVEPGDPISHDSDRINT